MNGENIDNDIEERWGRDLSSPVDEGWGWIYSIEGSATPLKTKGSWPFTQGTLSCYNPIYPPTIEIR